MASSAETPRLPTDADERVLWSGKPDPVASMTSRVDALLFGTFWLLMCGGAMSEAIGKGDGMMMTAVSPFCAIGVYFLLTPVLTYRAALGTTYAITDRRLIVAARYGRDITSILRTSIARVERRERGHKVTLRIPAANRGDEQKAVDIDMHGLDDGDTAYRLLTEPAG